MLKATIGVTVMMWVRWTLPRLRIDQVMTTCLKYCLPLSAICFVGVVGWQFFQLPSLNNYAGNVRENWVQTKSSTKVEPVAADGKKKESAMASPLRQEKQSAGKSDATTKTTSATQPSGSGGAE